MPDSTYAAGALSIYGPTTRRRLKSALMANLLLKIRGTTDGWAATFNFVLRTS